MDRGAATLPVPGAVTGAAAASPASPPPTSSPRWGSPGPPVGRERGNAGPQPAGVSLASARGLGTRALTPLAQHPGRPRPPHHPARTSHAPGPGTAAARGSVGSPGASPLSGPHLERAGQRLLRILVPRVLVLRVLRIIFPGGVAVRVVHGRRREGPLGRKRKRKRRKRGGGAGGGPGPGDAPPRGGDPSRGEAGRGAQRARGARGAGRMLPPGPGSHCRGAGARRGFEVTGEGMLHMPSPGVVPAK